MEHDASVNSYVVEGGKEPFRRQVGIGGVGNGGRRRVFVGASEVTTDDPDNACLGGCHLAVPGGWHHGGWGVGEVMVGNKCIGLEWMCNVGGNYNAGDRGA